MRIAHRASGILLHITSLPSDFGIGDLGPWSFRFIDLLSRIKQRYWNVLPISPTNNRYGNSPYETESAFAGNTLLISPESLVKNGLLSEEFVRAYSSSSSTRVDYKTVSRSKNAMLAQAYVSFKKSRASEVYGLEFESFCSEKASWLDDYAIFRALREKSGKPWYLWPQHIRDREPQSISRKNQYLKETVEREKFSQFIFAGQWRTLRDYCRKKNVHIFGDLPFYVGYDSADLWTHPELFKLDARKRPRFVAGVPPDYFSKQGQLWGDPVYRWSRLEKTSFRWWVDRIDQSLKKVDILRLDHFRGFVGFWQVPARAKTAKHGKWIKAPSKNFFRILKRRFPSLPFVAEDLGVITKDVKEALRFLGIPGMRILLFAFDGSKDNPHVPSNYARNTVVFTGTHDTNTVKGWFTEEATSQERRRVFKYFGRTLSENEVSHEFIKLAFASKANLAIIPMQDVLSLGSEARMNHPIRQVNNWEWRVTAAQLSSRSLDKLGEITQAVGRD